MAVPKLRFKEFDGDWSEKIISDIADVRGGKRLPKGYSLVESDTGYPYITVTDMEDGTVNCDKIRYVPLEAVDQIKRYRITVDDIYISVAGTLGLVGIIPYELNNANLTENADKLTNIKCDQKYLLHYLNSGSLSQLIDSVSTVGAQPKLALYAIQGMSIFLPAKAEQTKIASFLSAVDEKIAQLTQKHELLSQYKQGMMQKLFSQQIRFRADDGSEFGEWEETELGKHCQIKTGKLDANAMRPNGEFRFYTCAKEFYLIDEYAFDTEALLISGNGANVGYIHYYKGKFNAYQRTYVLDQWQQNIIFIQYFLEQFLKERRDAIS